MTFADLPPFAAFRFDGAVDGFEVAYFRPFEEGVLIDGYTSAVEHGEPYTVAYSIELDERWHTRRAQVTGHSLRGRHEVRLEADGAGRWTSDEKPLPELDGCLDLDLEASSLTNAFAVHRLGLEVGGRADAPAAYVRAHLRVQRLEQQYERVEDGARGARFDYLSVADGFRCVIEYDAAGIVVDYPGIAVRAA